MSVRTTLLKEVLTWVEDTLGISGSGSNPQVILAQRQKKSPLPNTKCLVLNFSSFDIPIGTAERTFPDTDDGVRVAHRQAMLEIRGFGPGTDAWLAELLLCVDAFSGSMAITSYTSNGVMDFSQQIHESIEEIYLLELLCEYGVSAADTAVTAAQSTVGFRDEDTGALHLTTVFQWE